MVWANRHGVPVKNTAVPDDPAVAMTISDAAPSAIWMTLPVVTAPREAPTARLVSPAFRAFVSAWAAPSVPFEVVDRSPKTLSSQKPSVSRNARPPNENFEDCGPMVSPNSPACTARRLVSRRKAGVSSGS